MAEQIQRDRVVSSCSVNVVIVRVASQPFNEDHLPEVINRHHQPEGIIFNIEDNPIVADDVGICVCSLHLCGMLREMRQNAASISLGDWFEYTIGSPVAIRYCGQRCGV